MMVEELRVADMGSKNSRVDLFANLAAFSAAAPV